MQQNGFAVGDAFWSDLEDEIIDQAAIDVKCLRSDTTRSSSHISRSELRDVSLQLAYLGGNVHGAPELSQPEAEIGPRQMTQPRRGERLPGVAQAHVKQAVALSF